MLIAKFTYVYHIFFDDDGCWRYFSFHRVHFWFFFLFFRRSRVTFYVFSHSWVRAKIDRQKNLLCYTLNIIAADFTWEKPSFYHNSPQMLYGNEVHIFVYKYIFCGHPFGPPLNLVESVLHDSSEFFFFCTFSRVCSLSQGTNKCLSFFAYNWSV